MKSLTATALALAFAATSGVASAQTYLDANGRYDGYAQTHPDRYGQSAGAVYDYARVLRVDPVIASGYGNGYGQSDANCRYTESTYAGGDRYYGDDRYYGNDRYRDDRYYGRNDPYYGNDRYGNGGYGTTAGSNIATVIGGLVGAAIGSQVGGGSARYATAAIGSMVGGMAGREIYESGQRDRYASRTGTVRVCDPVPYGSHGNTRVSDNRVAGYDVTYEYAGREFHTRTDYHPGDRIRVRVDVRPD
ncbi:MAG TPA: glycine zipper 2TM domain-containing protein [Xanthomonadaceae bacterium]|nr:glycine zipper 2TM domain-containing protein [Xanthomonadaceae bacterium]